MKLPILLGQGFATTAKPGLLSMLHEARTEIAMLCCTIFLAIADVVLRLALPPIVNCADLRQS